MKKRNFVLLTLLSIFLILIATAAVNKQTSKWQSSNEIQVNIDGSSRNLQDALNQGLLVNPSPSSIRSTDTVFSNNLGHNFEEILVSTNQGEMNLKEAISRADICGGSVISGEIDPGHFADEIEVTTSSGTKSLQEAINSQEVLYTSNSYSQCSDNDVYWFDSCNREESKKDECGSDGWVSNYYCKSNDVYRDYSTKGCSSNSCFDNLEERRILDCKGGFFSGRYNYQCSSGDCIGSWKPIEKRWNPRQEGYGCGTDVPPAPTDTCDGDQSTPYRCSSGETKNCQDADYISCNFNYPIWTGTWQVRTIWCYSP